MPDYPTERVPRLYAGRPRTRASDGHGERRSSAPPLQARTLEPPVTLRRGRREQSPKQLQTELGGNARFNERKV